MDPLAGPPEVTTTAIGTGALRTYAPTGMHVAHVPIFAGIGPRYEQRAD
jgi:hypothetical protein